MSGSAGFRPTPQGVSDYLAYLESPHGRLRLETVWRLLERSIERTWPHEPRGLRVLDAGCGTGEIALRLAARGHVVTLLDPAAPLLALAESNARGLAEGEAVPPRFVQGDLEQAASLLGLDPFDLVLCHHVLEYVDEPMEALAALPPLVARGGGLSLVLFNPWQQALRLALRDRRFDEAREALAGAAPVDSRFGVPRRGLSVEEIRASLVRLGLDVGEAQGVLVTADYVDAGALAEPAAFAALLGLELAAGARSPYREVARHHYLWARRP